MSFNNLTIAICGDGSVALSTDRLAWNERLLASDESKRLAALAEIMDSYREVVTANARLKGTFHVKHDSLLGDVEREASATNQSVASLPVQPDYDSHSVKSFWNQWLKS